MKRIICAVLLLVFCAVASAATITIEPASNAASLGAAVSIAVHLAGVSDLYAYQFDLSFGPAVLSVTNLIEGGLLRGGGSTFFFPGAVDNGSGTVTLTAGSLQGSVPGVSGGGTLATVVFTGVGFGASPVTVSNVVLLDSAGRDIVGTIIRNGSVTVVPEPMSVMLVGCGVLAIMIARVYGGNLHRS